MMTAFDRFFMQMALREAEKAAADGEVPTGCVIVEPASLAGSGEGAFDPDPTTARILARAHNQPEMLQDATAHAEMLALTAAASAKGAWRLTGTRLYVTKEPCPMCAAALAWAQLGRLVYGADDPRRGYTLFTPSLLHPRTEVVSGVLAGEAARLMTDFFKKQR